MAGVYVDTSALGRVLLAEPDASAIRGALARYSEWWSSSLLGVELGRLGKLRGKPAQAANLLGRITLSAVTEARLQDAASIEPAEVRSLDAIHLVAAVELHKAGLIAAVLTYDRQLTAGCAHHVIPVVAPVI